MDAEKSIQKAKKLNINLNLTEQLRLIDLG